jgi:FkbM family methyltransferase
MSLASKAADQPRTRNVTYHGRTVALADLPEYGKFYKKLTGGTWEPHTFEALARFLDRDTVAIDIGAWIGVTPFWTAQIAKAVVAVEPDPKCLAILEGLAAGQPNVTVLAGALSDRDSVCIHAVDAFGSSETSVLDIGDDGEATVGGIRLDEIMSHAGGAPVFVKIDIEGYEYLIGSELARLNGYEVRAIQLAVHPQLYEKCLGGPLVFRRLRTAFATWKLGRLFARSLSGPSLPKNAGLISYIVFGVILRRTPRGADFLFERRPPRTGKFS